MSLFSNKNGIDEPKFLIGSIDDELFFSKLDGIFVPYPYFKRKNKGKKNIYIPELS